MAGQDPAIGAANLPDWEEVANSPLVGSGAQEHTITLNTAYDQLLVIVDSFENTSGAAQDLQLRFNGNTTGYDYRDEAGTLTTGAAAWQLLAGAFASDELAGQILVAGDPVFRNAARFDTLLEEDTRGAVSGDYGAAETVTSLTFRGATGTTTISARVYGWSQ